jgi:long-chain acyl-CoA synthetase
MEKPWLDNYDPGIPDTMTPPPIPLDRYLADTARDLPDRTALIFGVRVGSRLLDRHISYADLNTAVDRFAAGLQQMGVGKGDRVAIMLPNCPQFVIAAYAVWRIGAVVVCCNPLYMPREIEYLVNDAGATTFIVMSGLYERIRDIRPKTGLKRVIVTNIKEYFQTPLKWLFTLTKEKKEGHRVDFSGDADTVAFQDILAKAPVTPQPVSVSTEDTSTLIYTSGTTGRPKGARHIHRSQALNSEMLNLWAQSRKGEDVMLAVMPFFHIYGLAIVLNTVVAGGLTAVLIPNPRDMDHVLRAIEKHRINYYLGVPAMFVGFNNHPLVGKTDLSSLRFAASAAAPLAPEVQDRFEAITGAKMVEAYGLTETICAAMNPVENTRHNSIGLPMPGTEMRIVDEGDGTIEQPPGTPGEIIVKGAQVMQGYWENPEATDQVMKKGPDNTDGWFYTGDIGTMDEDGFFHIVDRKNDMIISGGYNIYPAEVEAVLFEHPAVLEAAVFGIPHGVRGENVKTAIVLKPGHTATADDITAFCRERLAAYKVPKIVEFKEDLPKSIVGKVLRRKLREEEAAS